MTTMMSETSKRKTLSYLVISMVVCVLVDAEWILKNVILKSLIANGEQNTIYCNIQYIKICWNITILTTKIYCNTIA